LASAIGSGGDVNLAAAIGTAVGGGLGLWLLSSVASARLLPTEFIPVGSVVVSSEVKLEAYEALTKGLMWSKEITILYLS
jgi:hypothetical protein